MKNKREQIADLLIWWALIGSVVKEDTDEIEDFIFRAWRSLYAGDVDIKVFSRAHPVYVTKILPLVLAREPEVLGENDLTIDEALKGLQDMLENT